MHLLTVLACGIPAAANGRAYLYKRGTSTKATWYSLYTGYGANATGYVTLDSLGGATAYVNEQVDVKVVNSLGATVREFTEMLSDSALEVISSAFTGTDYVGGAAAVSKPAILQAVLDLWKTQNGAEDWQVYASGTEGKIGAFLSQVVGVFYNVKDPRFGAKGDVTTDDTSAIQQAITQAHNDGGGTVVFPAGTYKTTDTLNCYSDVSLVGMGASVTIVQVAHGTAAVLTYGSAGASGSLSVVQGLTLRASQTNTGKHVSITATSYVSVRDCVLGSSFTSGYALATTGATVSARISIQDSWVYTGDSTSFGVVANSSNAYVYATRCKFVAATGAFDGTLLSGYHVSATGCEFNFALATSGTCQGVMAVSADNRDMLVTGCRFTASGGATATGILIADAIASYKMNFFEAQNSFLCNTAIAPQLTALSAVGGGQFVLLTRETRSQHVNRTGVGDVSVDALKYGITLIHDTYAGNCNVNVSGPDYEGQEVTIIYYNNTGGGRTLTTPIGGAASQASTDGKAYHIYAKAVESTLGALAWVMVNKLEP